MKYKVTLGDKQYEVEVEKGEAIVLSETAVSTAPVAAPVAAAAPAAAPTAPVATAAGEVVPSPMPGTVLAIKCTAGASVKKGDILIILEAMKMENEITAPRDGVVAQIVTTSGASVETGSPLIILN